MMKDGRPYSNENGYVDDRLITDESEFVQKIVRAWIYANIVPCRTPNNRHTSYGIKHILQNDTSIYLTNNQFKDAMLLAGFRPVNARELNWTYRIKETSPAFKYYGDGSRPCYHHGLSCAVFYDEIHRVYTEEWERKKKAAGNTSEQADAKPLNDVPPPDDMPSHMSIPDDWETFLKQCCERLPPMYHSFLSNCTGATLSNGIFTLYVSNSPDSIILRRLNNQRVMDVLQELSRAEHVRMREGMPPQDNTPQPDEVSQGDAKKPVYQDNTADCPHTAPYCPECGHILIDGNGDNFNFCPDCGQKIDWQETQ